MEQPLILTPGGVLLPIGTRIAEVIPGLAGRGRVTRAGRGSVPRAAQSGRAPTEGTPRSYQSVYDTQQYVAAVVNKLARHFARVPWLVERSETIRSAEVVRRRWRLVEDEHPLARLLERPAPRLGPYALKLWIAHGLLVEGNALTFRHRDDPDGPPTQLFPLQWDKHAAYRQSGGLIDRWVSTELGSTRVMDAERDVLHVAYWSRSGAAGQIGLSPLEQLADPLRIDDVAQRHAYSQLAGGAHPSGAFVLPPEIDLDENVAAALRAVLDAWTGADAAGVPVLARGAKWETFTPTAKDTALIETRQRSLEEVCMVYDVSPVAIGELSHATQRGNVAELLRDLYTGTLAPPIAGTLEAVNTQLVEPETWDPSSPDERLRVRADVSEFVRGDPEKWDRIVNERIRHGRLTVNRARELDGEEPWEDPRADEPMILDSNIHPLSQVGDEEPPAPDAPPAPERA